MSALFEGGRLTGKVNTSAAEVSRFPAYKILAHGGSGRTGGSALALLPRDGQKRGQGQERAHVSGDAPGNRNEGIKSCCDGPPEESEGGKGAPGESEMKTYQDMRVVTRKEAAAALNQAMRTIDRLGVNCASQPNSVSGRLRYVISQREKYFFWDDIQALDERDRELRNRG